MRYHCCSEARRNAVDAHPGLNGIDYLEVVDNDAPTENLRQKTLLVYLLEPVPVSLSRDQVRIEGGERVRNIGIEWVAAASAPPSTVSSAEETYYSGLVNPERVLLVRTDCYGDFSTYTLRLVRSPVDSTQPQGFDPILSAVDFSFKVECESEFDCKTVPVCPEPDKEEPVIDYLAKDYSSFRRLILDRMAQLVPGWRERSAADLGVTLAELIAYVGDNLSYRQDAIATEAYLETARRRSSLRRHGILVDYHMHNGCNARVWLHLNVTGDLTLDRNATRFYTRVPGVKNRLEPGASEDMAALSSSPVVFEPLHSIDLYKDHNDFAFYTWGESRCCLPKDATRATLAGHWPELRAGDVLLFDEKLGPNTNEPGDADPSHRHVVRLTSVRAFSPDDTAAPPVTPLTDPLNGEEITEIAWTDEDRIPFPLCISAQTDPDHGGKVIDNVSVAYGNMVLADHGYSVTEEDELGSVPKARLVYPNKRATDRCGDQQDLKKPPRFAPLLNKGPLTFAGTVMISVTEEGITEKRRVSFDPKAPAAAAMIWRMEKTLPQITVNSRVNGAQEKPWSAVGDLLDCDGNKRAFVVEMEHDGSTRLRFGDGVYGLRPVSGMEFFAKYRVGNGLAGNVGAETIAHVVSSQALIQSVRNPLPASGGEDMMDAATVRNHAPHAFRRQERAVTPEDYETVTERHSGVQRAAATMRWTGSWHTMFLTVDRQGGLPMNTGFERELTDHVERYRMAGHDTEFNDPVYVSLDIELLVCVQPEYFRADVKKELLQVLGSTILADGRRGLFHPDNLSFGQTVYLSRLYAAARMVAGVASVNATRFQKLGRDDTRWLDDGFMALSRLEIARLDNDANYPEHGVLNLNLFGGK